MSGDFCAKLAWEYMVVHTMRRLAKILVIFMILVLNADLNEMRVAAR